MKKARSYDSIAEDKIVLFVWIDYPSTGTVRIEDCCSVT